MNYVTLSMAIEKHAYVIKASGGLECECQPKSEPLAHEFLSHSCS